MEGGEEEVEGWEKRGKERGWKGMGRRVEASFYVSYALFTVGGALGGH